MSKFEYANFYEGYDNFAVNKEKYTKKQAIEMYKTESEHTKAKYIAVCEAFVRHRAGINGDNEPCVGWWLEYIEHKRSCAVFAFHTTNNKNEKFKDYEYYELY